MIICKGDLLECNTGSLEVYNTDFTHNRVKIGTMFIITNFDEYATYLLDTENFKTSKWYTKHLTNNIQDKLFIHHKV